MYIREMPQWFIHCGIFHQGSLRLVGLQYNLSLIVLFYIRENLDAYLFTFYWHLQTSLKEVNQSDLCVYPIRQFQADILVRDFGDTSCMDASCQSSRR